MFGLRLGPVAVAGMLAAGLCASAHGQVVDRSLALNYNWNGMVHTGESGQPDQSDASGLGFRSLADRALVINGSTAATAALGAVPIVGATGLPYSIVTTANTLDMVFLGNRGITFAFEATTPGTLPNRGVQPLWLPNTDLTSDQTTAISPAVTLDAFSEIGLLYHITNGGGNFTVTLGFTDSTTTTVTVNGRDWFGTQTALAPGASSGLSIQATRGNFRGANNEDSGLPVSPTTAQALNVWEAVIDAQRLVSAGLGSVAGKQLSSISFRHPTGTVTRAFGIFAASVRSGLPANASCASATVLTGSGDTSVVLSARTGGQTPSPCGVNDSTALWYSFTPATSVVIEARTCGATIDTTLSVFSSCGGAAVVCNDNGCGSASRVQWQGVAGQSYLIRVGGNNAATGTVTLGLAAPANTDIPMPLGFNFNGMCHGPLEQTTTNPVNDNRANPLGYRAIADRGFLVDGTSTSLNFGGTIGFTGIPYQIHPTPLTRDMVALGDRNIVANGARAFLPAIIVGNNNGLQPSWLPSTDLTGPQASGMGSLGAVMGTQTAVGLLYHITDSGGRFDVTLTFTDATSVTATVAAPDWFGGTALVPAALPGVAIQRRLGTTYNSVRDTDNGNLAAANERLGVIEGVVTRDSLLSATGFDISGRTLASIVFSNPISNNTTAVNPGATPANRSGVGIFAATLRNPASVSLNFNPSGNGTATPALVRVGGATKLTVQTVPGTGTPNTVTSVSLNASSVGLGTLAMFDNGTGGDVVANDGIYTRDLSFPVNTTPGTISLPFTVTDAQNRTSAGDIFFAVVGPSGAISPSPAIAGQSATVTVTLAPGTFGPADIASVVVSSPGVISATQLSDSGLFPDLTQNDGLWTGTVNIDAAASGGPALVDITATDVSSRVGAGSFNASIVGPPVATDLGTLAVGSTQNVSGSLSPGGIIWFKFTLATAIDAASLSFLDIDTEGSSLAGTTPLANDTMIGLYTATGARVAFDDDDGTEGFSQLSFGLTSPARPSPGNGLAYNGRDGAILAPGTYFLSASAFSSTFNAANWSVTTTSVGTGTINVRLAAGTFASSGGVPTTFADLGTIGTATATATRAVGPGEVRWFRFALDADIAAASRTYLDIDTEGSTLADTIIGLFRDDGSGTFVLSDDNDGSGTLSQLAFGRAARKPVGDGLTYNGRDGANLAAGTYYLAVAQPTVAFGSNFVVAFTTGSGSGDVTVKIRRGTMPENVFFGPVVNPANGNSYYLLVQGLSWSAARDAGIALGGNLTTINDADENEWIRLNVNRFDGVSRRCFIGYTDEVQEGVFAWADGSTAAFTNWLAGEPNNGGTSGNAENYVEQFGDGFWNDIFAAGASVGGSFSIVEIPRTCPADFNNSGTRDVTDIFAFLTAWFANAPGSDFNNSGVRDVTDIFAFLTAWFAGCP